jgi:tetratricopeptide (TPR) repeat protein
VQAHINLISLYGRTGRIEQAQEHYQTAIKLNPNMAQAYYDYGVLLFGQGKRQEAEQAFRHALEINPYYADAHNNLGGLLEMQRRLDSALQEFEKAIAERPNYRLAHFHLGRVLVNQGKYDEAIQHFLKTLAPEDESTPTYLYALGATYARAGDRASALLYIRKAREKAAARGQTRLLASIDQDLRTLEQGDTPRP